MGEIEHAVEFVVDGNTARIVRAERNDSRGRRLAARLRGRGSSGMSTDQIMALLRAED
jgi:hypothetical protein